MFSPIAHPFSQDADTTATPSTSATPLMRLDDSPRLIGRELQGITTGRVAYREGITPHHRAMLPGYDSGIACLLIGAFLLISFNLRHYTTMLKSLPRDLFSVRRRDNLFEEHTINETRLLASMLLLLFLDVAILAAASISAFTIAPPVSHFMLIVELGVAMAIYYFMQTAAYSAVGFIFTDPSTARLWLKGFNASQSTLGLALVIPALIVVFEPGTVLPVTIIAAALYIVARIIFIYKGFRLFYHKIGSIVYFILYLCTLEVAPLFVIVRAYRFIAL